MTKHDYTVIYRTIQYYTQLYRTMMDYKGQWVSQVLERLEPLKNFKGFSRKLQNIMWVFKENSRIFLEFFKEISCVFWECFKEVLFCNFLLHGSQAEEGFVLLMLCCMLDCSLTNALVSLLSGHKIYWRLSLNTHHTIPGVLCYQHFYILMHLKDNQDLSLKCSARQHFVFNFCPKIRNCTPNHLFCI